MCEPKNGIRLCTCGAEELNKRAMWILYSKTHIIGTVVGHEISHIGAFFYLLLFVLLLPLYALFAFVVFVLLIFSRIWRILPHDWHRVFKSIVMPRKAKYIVKQLNEGNAFDFSYQPRNGDILMVRWGWRKYYFDYRAPSHPSYDGWQMRFAYEVSTRLKRGQTREKMRGFAKP